MLFSVLISVQSIAFYNFNCFLWVYHKIQSPYVLNESELFSYSEYYGGGHINTQIKGECIKTNGNSLEKRSLEMCICIQRRTIKVDALPNYYSVAELDNPERI